jgi:hypothetical protein
MERYVHQANIDLYRHLIAESERDQARDEDRHNADVACRRSGRGSEAARLGACPGMNGAAPECTWG